jgi:hypothetical protein
MWAMVTFLGAFAVLVLENTTLAPRVSFGAGLAIVVALICWCFIDAWEELRLGSVHNFVERATEALLAQASACMTGAHIGTPACAWPRRAASAASGSFKTAGRAGSTHITSAASANVAMPGGVIPPKKLHERRWEQLKLWARRGPGAGAAASTIPMTMTPHDTRAATSATHSAHGHS